MNINIKCVKNRIEELCANKGWSFYRLSKEAGFQQSTLKPIIKEKNMPSLYTISKICEAFNISLATFFKSDIFEYNTISEEKYINLWDKLSESDKKLVLIYMYGLLKTIPDFKGELYDLQRIKNNSSSTP